MVPGCSDKARVMRPVQVLNDADLQLFRSSRPPASPGSPRRSYLAQLHLITDQHSSHLTLLGLREALAA
jgi:hypothetical protein